MESFKDDNANQGNLADDGRSRVDLDLDLRLLCRPACLHCGQRRVAQTYIPCPMCQAVLYCSKDCLQVSWRHGHKDDCEKLKTVMEMEEKLAKLPFTFSEVTTSRLFSQGKLKAFLVENDVYNKGLWKRECPAFESMCSGMTFGDLQCDENPYALPLEGAALDNKLPEPPSLDKPLQNWSDYYSTRGFWMDSPVAGLLHYPLTLYRIITHHMRKNYPGVFVDMRVRNHLEVHIIGAEKEAEMFHPFLESARLLAPLKLSIHLFGDELSKKVDNHKQEAENLRFHLHCGLYHENNLQDLPKPDVVIGFNAGLSAYYSFVDTIKALMVNKTPLYCTDYCYYSISHSKKALKQNQMAIMLKPVINPFRSPFRIVDQDMNLPRYSNAFIFCLKPFDPT